MDERTWDLSPRVPRIAPREKDWNTKEKNHTFLKVALTSIAIKVGCIFLALLLACGVAIFYATRPDSYFIHETTDIAQYGTYTGTGHNDYVHDYIHSFFPDTIDDSFSDVTYSYCAKSIDQCAFEAYLEFVIEDPDLFAQHIAQVGDVEWEPFAFDSRYMEYTLSEKMDLFHTSASEDGKLFYWIESAKMGKILYEPHEQRIIYVALGVFDGGGTNTQDLHVFFDRFNIDPAEISPPRD